MSGDPYVLIRLAITLVRMVGGDVEDVRLSAFFRPENGHRIGCDHARYLAIGIIDGAEESRTTETGFHARRSETLRHAVQAKIALVRGPSAGVQEACIVRARLDAIFATDADIRIHYHDAVLFALVGGPGRADRHTVRRAAVVTEPRQEVSAHIRIISLLDVLDPRSI